MSSNDVKVCTLCHIEKEKKEFNKKSSAKDGLQNVCKDCSKTRFQIYWNSNKEKHRKEAGARRDKVRNATKSYVLNIAKQNGCVDCLEKDPACLDFDHIKGNKIKGISEMCNEGSSLAKVVAEIEKCELRCANCHRKKTAKDFDWYKNVK